MSRVVALAVLAAACGGDPAVPDAVLDAPLRCDPTGTFGPPELLAELSSDRADVSARLSPDELTITFSRLNTGGTYDLWTASRASNTMPFAPPQLLTTVNSIRSDVWPTVSPDGLVLLFDADRTTPGTFHIWVSTRATATAPFGPPTPSMDVMDSDSHAMIANPTSVYFMSPVRPGMGASDLFRADLGPTGAITDPVQLVGGVNTVDDEVAPTVTLDERQILFRRTVAAEPDIYLALRSTAQDGFGPATVVAGLDVVGVDEVPTWISPDACNLYLHSNAPVAGGPPEFNLYVARRGL